MIINTIRALTFSTKPINIVRIILLKNNFLGIILLGEIYMKNHWINKFIEELLMYSGLYANMYILMNISKSGLGYFKDMDHIVLLLALFTQTLLMVRYGDQKWIRFAGTFITPLVYTLYEYNSLYDFITNTGHFFFWFFSITIGLVNLIWRKKDRKIVDIFMVIANVLIFLFVYMYMDMMLSNEKLLLASQMTVSEYDSNLSIFMLSHNFIHFLADSAHIYLILGGVVLGAILVIGRLRVYELTMRIRTLFGLYVDEHYVTSLIENPDQVSQTKRVAILFADIRGFTHLTEQKEADAVIQILNAYISIWSELMPQYQGKINKIIGDAILAVFIEDDLNTATTRATQCALSFLKKYELSSLSKSLEGIGIAIHYGDAILGNIGGPMKKDYTVIGDVVNTASRLESKNKDYHSKMLISDSVYNLLEDDLKNHFQFKESLLLRGKNNPISIYTLGKECSVQSSEVKNE